MQIKSIKGISELKSNYKKLGEQYGKAVAKATLQGAQLVRTSAVQSIQQQSNGEAVTRYRLGGRPYSHIASKAGDAPNTDTGALVRSINVEVRPDATYVGTTLKYAPFLEFGTSTMGERPFLNPALEKNKNKISELIKNAMRAER
jgi:HK97 gp10 family phage protein